LNQYKNNILALSAYNAGTANVNKWLKLNSYNKKYPELFIELIPFSETKNYVKNVLLSDFFYKKLLNE